MKFVTIALVIALAMPQVFSVTPSCTATNYCKGCSDVTLGNCTECFSWGSGSVLARLLVSNACATKRVASLDTNCKWYEGTSATDVKAVSTCTQCKSGYVHLRVYSGALSSSNLATNWTSTTCTKNSSTYKEISNCHEGSTVFVTGTGITSSSFCQMCKKSYKNGATLDTNSGGFTTCISGAAYTNCEYSMISNTPDMTVPQLMLAQFATLARANMPLHQLVLLVLLTPPTLTADNWPVLQLVALVGIHTISTLQNANWPQVWLASLDWPLLLCWPCSEECLNVEWIIKLILVFI